MKNILLPISKTQEKHKHTFLIDGKTKAKFTLVQENAAKNGFVFDVDSLLKQTLTKAIAAAEKELANGTQSEVSKNAASVVSDDFKSDFESEVLNEY